MKVRRLYLMRIELPSGMLLHKIGVASHHSAKERMLTICGSIFDKFRETPKIKLVRDRKVDSEKVFKYETMLHKFFSNYQYTSKHRFDGITECFVLPSDSADAIQAYEAVLAGHVPESAYVMPDRSEDELPF